LASLRLKERLTTTTHSMEFAEQDEKLSLSTQSYQYHDTSNQAHRSRSTSYDGMKT